MEDLLNELFQDVTFSVMTAYGYSTTTANATIDTLINVCSFSSPANLVLPYFLSLAISLPFTILGLWALRQNGVPAPDGEFIQLLTSTTRRPKLGNEAAKHCLDGNIDVPPSPKDMEIIFGELVTKEGGDGLLKRAGFLTDDKIRLLVKGIRYGERIVANAQVVVDTVADNASAYVEPAEENCSGERGQSWDTELCDLLHTVIAGGQS